MENQEEIMTSADAISLDEAMYYLMATERQDDVDGIRWYRNGIVVGSNKDDSITVKIDNREQEFINEEAKRLMKIGSIK